MDKKHKNNGLLITVIICSTIVILGAIGAFLYMDQQKLIQDKELRQQELTAQNERSEKDRIAGEAKLKQDCEIAKAEIQNARNSASGYVSPFASLYKICE